MSERYIVEIGTSPAPFYLAIWSGDPGRTFDQAYARRYRTERGARIGLGMARSSSGRALSSARIIGVPDER